MCVDLVHVISHRQMEKMETAEYQAMLECICKLVGVTVRVTRGEHVVFQHDGFAQLTDRWLSFVILRAVCYVL
jgi:hypothetical protein